MGSRPLRTGTPRPPQATELLPGEQLYPKERSLGGLVAADWLCRITGASLHDPPWDALHVSPMCSATSSGLASRLAPWRGAPRTWAESRVSAPAEASGAIAANERSRHVTSSSRSKVRPMRRTSPAAAGPCHSSSVALPRVQVVGGESRTRDSQLARTSGEQRSSVVPRRLRAREDHTGRVGSVSRSRSGPGSLSDAPPRSKTPRASSNPLPHDGPRHLRRLHRGGPPVRPLRSPGRAAPNRSLSPLIARAAAPRRARCRYAAERSIVHEGVHQASTGTSPRDGRTLTPPLNAGGRRMDACVSVPSEPSAMPLTTEITGPPEEPPECAPRPPRAHARS